MDRLSTLLEHFSLRAGVFHTGSLCGIHRFQADALRGHLHLVERGLVRITGVGRSHLLITEPTIVFLPRPGKHRVVADEREGADAVCATVQFAGGGTNPVTDSLPSVVSVLLADLPGSAMLVRLMFQEASSSRCGRQAALDRLCEVLMIQLLRHCLDRGITQVGALAGLSDPRLARAMVAMHDDPSREWDLSAMAGLAGMSRARFAVRFREVIGQTPADYLASWRILVAQRLLRRGLPIKQVAYDVGYGSPTALARVFVRKIGCTPSRWLGKLREPSAAAGAERQVE